MVCEQVPGLRNPRSARLEKNPHSGLADEAHVMCTGTHTHSHSPGVLPPLPLSSSSQGSFGEQQQLWSRWLIVQAIKETCQTERDDPEGIARMGAGPLRDWRCVS